MFSSCPFLPCGSITSVSGRRTPTLLLLLSFSVSAYAGSPGRRDGPAPLGVGRIQLSRAVADGPVISDSTVTFRYAGQAAHVSVVGDFNGWDPAADTMRRLPGSSVFIAEKMFDPASRFEYKYVVDSAWILDPRNPRQARGGFGLNSEIWMPRYMPPREIEKRRGIRRGYVDSISIISGETGRTYPVFVYLPTGYGAEPKSYPALYVTDGGDYLTFGRMKTILDNMITDRRVPPLIAVLVGPGVSSAKPGEDGRLADYAMSDSFVAFLATELRPWLVQHYRVDTVATRTAIIGVSLGAVCATYAAIRRPDIFGMCGAQSPAFWWEHMAIIARVLFGPRVPVRFWIGTGTMRDARRESLLMRDILGLRGYEVRYVESPEGHNWAHWRARVPEMLEYFWGPR